MFRRLLLMSYPLFQLHRGVGKCPTWTSPNKKRDCDHLQQIRLKLTFKKPQNRAENQPIPVSTEQFQPSGGRTPVPRPRGAPIAPRRAVAAGCWAVGYDCWAAGSCVDSCCDPPRSPNFERWCGDITHPRIRLASGDWRERWDAEMRWAHIL